MVKPRSLILWAVLAAAGMTFFGCEFDDHDRDHDRGDRITHDRDWDHHGDADRDHYDRDRDREVR